VDPAMSLGTPEAPAFFSLWWPEETTLTNNVTRAGR
jgi:hypothetical protein